MFNQIKGSYMWAYAIKGKITAAILLFSVVLLGILANFGERSNAQKINTAVASIYQDRLVVEGYIFDHARLLNDIEEIIEGNEPAVKKQELITKALAEISRLNSLYAETQLTANEKTNFDEFIGLCTRLSEYIASHEYSQAKVVAARAGNVLYILSGIQMEEAKAQMDNVVRVSSFSSIISQFEIGILIIILVVIQVLVLSSQTVASVKFTEKAHLN
jgi:hypothetical protein